METPNPRDNLDTSFIGRRWASLEKERLTQEILDEMERQAQPGQNRQNELTENEKAWEDLFSLGSFITRRNIQMRQQAIDEFAHQFAAVDNTRKEMIRREAERTLTNDVLENEAMRNGFDATIEQFERSRGDTTPPDQSA